MLNLKPKLFAVLMLLFWAMSSQAQMHYTLALKGGISNCNGLNHAFTYDDDGYRIENMYIVTDGNHYSYGLMYAIEASVIEPIEKTRISLETGLGFESKDFWVSRSTSEKSVPYSRNCMSLTIPLKVHYALSNNRFSIWGGGSNVVRLKYTSLGTNYRYNVRANVGGDWTLVNRYLVGLEYAHDITPFSKMKYYDISYRFDLIALKVGILF